jgi:hypothetical protein
MSDLSAFSGQDTNSFATGTLDASGHLIWNPAAPDFSQCDGIQIDEPAEDTTKSLTIWFAVDRGSVKLDANCFPSFNITTALAPLPQISLTFSKGQWYFSATISGLKPGLPQTISFAFAPDNTGPLPPSQTLSVQFTPSLVSTPPDLQVDVNSGQNLPWNVTVGFVAMSDPSQWALRVSTTAVTLSGQFWKALSFGTTEDLTLQFTYLPGIRAILNQGPYSRALLELTGFDSDVAAYWNNQIAQPYLLSVLTAEPDAPISALWTVPQGAAPWSFCAYVSNLGVLTQGPHKGDLGIAWQPGCFSLPAGTSISFELPDFLVHSGNSFQGNATLRSVNPDTTLTDQLATRVTNPGAIVFIAFRIATMTPSASQMVRLGALDLTFSTDSSSLNNNDSWHVLGYLEPAVNQKLPKSPRIVVQDLELAVSKVQVGSEDPLPNQTGESPLVIPLTQVGTGLYQLLLAESNPFGSQRNLTLTLNQNQGGGGSVSLLVLDRNPFLVARVYLPSLLGSAAASNALVAEWSNTYANGEGWHTQSGAQPFTVYLPPQGVGEQYERSDEDPNPIGNGPVDFRFSPAAHLQIAPPVLQGATDTYFEAPWNLRRLLFAPGQNVPGSRLPAFGAELLYGLPVSVSSSALWVAELAALTGRLAAPLPSRATEQDQEDWDDAIQAFNTRLSIWTPWDGVQPNSLLLSDEAQFSLRSSADLAYPALDVRPSGTAPYPESQNGLEGGVAWIFESESQYRSVWQQPNSTSALLADPVFSALGGWARQRAVFLSGLTTINSRVEMGRVSTISLEQLGRIGVLWNRAKLVTVYERTVQASDQFEGQQDQLLGRPIVRKVAEYVELLEPIRSYPESGSSGIDVAFVQGSEFKSKVITVDSSWGSDLPSGMQVPLWNPEANPNLYPKPHVVLQVAVDPNTGHSTQSQEIDEPEKLVFYSDTGQGAGPNPDLWPAVQGIDYTDVDTTVTNNQNYRLSTHPGLGSFTWGLLPAAFPTNVVAQRTSSSISASLKNVSMMRSQPKSSSTQQKPATLLPINQVLDGANSVFQEISDYWSKDGAQSVVNNRALGSYFSGLPTFATSFTLDANLTLAGQAITNAGLTFLQQAVTGAVSTLQSVQVNITTAIQGQPGNIVSVANALGATLNSKFGGLDVGSLKTGLTRAPTRLANIGAQIPSSNEISASFGQPGQTLTLLKGLQQTVAQNVQSLTSDLAQFESLLGDGFLPGWPQLATIEARVAQPYVALQNGADITQATTQEMVTDALTLLSGDLGTLNTVIGTLQPLPFTTIDLGTPPLSKVNSLQDAKDWLASIQAQTQSAITAQMQVIQKNLGDGLLANIPACLPADAGTMKQTLIDAAGGLQDVLLARSLLAGAGSFGIPQVAQLQDEFQTAASTFLSTATSAIGSDITSAVYNQGSQILSTVRAFGAAPIAPGLTFNLPEVQAPSLDQLAYFFDNALTNVPVTSGVQSALASVAQSLPQLMPIQLNVPISSLLDRLVPDPAALAQTAISDIFNNLAGMDLSSLFSGLLPPLNAPDGINIKHSINPQTLSVTVEADIDVSFPNDVTVLNAGPILLQLSNARFQATVKIEETPGSQPVEQVNGQISGDWELQIANLSLVTFVSTSLTFDQTGHIRFNVSPEKVQLASVMQFIADLVNSLGSPGSGLSIVFSPSPIAVVSTLDLPLPDIAGGAFALSNIRLGALFSIGMDDQNNFMFVVGVNLSEEDAPFAIVIFILGGGGWIQAQMSYTAKAGASPDVSVTIGISAIASLEIALGPISGGVSISFSLFAEYSTGSSLDLGIVIVVAGHVSLLGIVDADITLLLEADYAGGQLTGRGSVSVDIKICWCFTLSIHQEVEYKFGNQQSGGQQNVQQALFAARVAVAAGPDDFWNNASSYIDMLAA